MVCSAVQSVQSYTPQNVDWQYTMKNVVLNCDPLSVVQLVIKNLPNNIISRRNYFNAEKMSKILDSLKLG